MRVKGGLAYLNLVGFGRESELRCCEIASRLQVEEVGRLDVLVLVLTPLI